MKKGVMKTEDALGNDDVAQAHVEEAALKLFDFADGQDRKSIFSK